MAGSYIEIDMSQLFGLADRLGQLTGERFDEVGRGAVNEVATRTEPKLRESIVATINLGQQYVADRTGVRLAEAGSRPEATIYAPYRHTPLGRYAAQMITKPVKNQKRSKGNPKLGIPAGQKLAGISVEVVHGRRRLMANPTAFFSPTQRDTGGNPMIFTRRTAGRYPVRARYGPSVYQLFRVARDNFMDEIATDLELTLLADTESALDEVFA